MLIYHGLPDQTKLIVPNIVGFAMLGMILIVLVLFFGPFLKPSTTFSVGTDRVQDGLGIGVRDKVDNALQAAAAGEHQTYHYLVTNANGDIERDYTVTRVGDDYHIAVQVHTEEGDPALFESNGWLIDGVFYMDSLGKVVQASEQQRESILGQSIPSAVFQLPDEILAGNWRAISSRLSYTATGTSPSLEKAIVVIHPETGRLQEIWIGSAESGLHAEIRVNDIAQAEVDRDDLVAGLKRAKVLGDVDRSDAAMQDYVQKEAFFVLRYPRDWNARRWDPELKKIEFSSSCGSEIGCPELEVSVYEIEEGAGSLEAAEDLVESLDMQPQYREIRSITQTIADKPVNAIAYTSDRTVKGEIETARHIEYIFMGEESRYHLNFSSPESTFAEYIALFEHMASMFVYLEEDWEGSDL
jgi:hypothetical protein